MDTNNYTVSHQQYLQLLQALEDERISHAATKQQLMGMTEKLDFAEGEIEALKQQLAREKKQFDRAFALVKSKQSQSCNCAHAKQKTGNEAADHSSTQLSNEESDTHLPIAMTTSVAKQCNKQPPSPTRAACNKGVTVPKSSTTSSQEGRCTRTMSSVPAAGKKRRDKEVDKLVERLQQQRMRHQKQLEELTIEQQQQQYYHNLMNT